MKILSFDAETNGLYGDAFAIGAIVYNKKGQEIDRFVARLPDSSVADEWVRENVLPQLSGFKVTHESYLEMLREFADFYMRYRESKKLVHMGCPVEAKLIIDMSSVGFIGQWDGPYPLIDVAGHLEMAGEDPTSIDKFLKKSGINVAGFEGGTHNPLYDSAAAASTYFELMSGK